MLKSKKKFVSSIIAIMMLMSSISAFAEGKVQKFWDVSTDFWAFDYIADLAERGVIKGYDDGSFQPMRSVSRAEWAKIMVDAAGLTASDNNVYYTDMSAEHWANKHVNAARDYLTGYKDGTFRPNQAATREDVAVSLVLLKGYSIADVDYSYLTFSDNDTISNYAKAYVAVAVKENLIAGFTDNTFRGQDTLSRAQAATLLYRAFQHGNADKVIGGNATIQPTTKPSKDEEYNNQGKPSTSPEPTQEPRPESAATVSTLVSKPGVRSTYNYTTDNRGNLYYATDDAVYKLDITNGTKEEFQLNSGLDIIGDDVDLTNFKTRAICWDISTNRLLMQGSYDNINAADPDNVNNKFIISTPGMDGELELITSNFDVENGVTSVDSGWARIVCTTSDGSIVSNKYMFNGDNLDGIRIVPESDHWVTDYIITPNAMQIGNGIYYVGVDDDDYTFAAYEYDYKEAKELFEFTAYAFGVCKDGRYTITDEGLKWQNWKGKTIKQIS